jgi:hypothetical protein
MYLRHTAMSQFLTKTRTLGHKLVSMVHPKAPMRSKLFTVLVP